MLRTFGLDYFQKIFMKKYRITFLFLLVSMASMGQVKKVVADKIIATIGDKIVLQSDINNAIMDAERQGQAVPANAGCLLLQQSLAVKALVLQAEKDSIPVSDEEIEADLDKQIRGFIAQYGSKEVLEQIAGKTIFQLKEDYRESFRDQRLAKGERDKIEGGVRITPEEVKAYFDEIPKDSLPFYESHLEVGEIVMFPKPSRDVEVYTMDQLKKYKKEVEDGTAKFAELASQFSDDPGSKRSGGQFDVNRNDKSFDPIFLAKAFSLKDGQISSVFKTQFGYHIIQMVSRNGDDATIRHILKIPQVSSIEINATKAELDSVRAQLVKGTITFGQAVSKYSQGDATKFTGGRIADPTTNETSLTIDQFGKDLALMLPDLKVGEYSEPVAFINQQGKQSVRLVVVLSRTEPHRENMKDDYDKISGRAMEEKKQDKLEQWFQEKAPGFYISVAEEYQHCPELKHWISAKATALDK